MVYRALSGELTIPQFQQFGKTVERVLQTCGKAPESVAICTVDGQQWSYGDRDVSVCLQELAHCVTYMIARDEWGRKIHDRIGLLVFNVCGFPFVAFSMLIDD